jgi:hypothetical protein
LEYSWKIDKLGQVDDKIALKAGLVGLTSETDIFMAGEEAGWEETIGDA